jgi:hypothetical protein
MKECHMHQRIINAVDGSVTALTELFQMEPTRFFTENDLVCCFNRLLYNSLESLGMATAKDKDGFPHDLVHCEYPTPFRCDMKGKGFQAKSDEDITPQKGKFRRGHYDVVVLNPTFVRNHSYAAIKGQTYAAFQSTILSSLSQHEPAFLYGIEFAYSRDEIKSPNGQERFIAEVLQDAAKLEESVRRGVIMKKATMLAFAKGTTNEVIEPIRHRLQSVAIVKLATAK